jgi:hypothetical protein
MLEGVFGRLLGGALWGLGAGVVLAVTRGNKAELRPLAKGLMKAYLTVSERARETLAEARENLEDVYAEAKAERDAEAAEGISSQEPAEEQEPEPASAPAAGPTGPVSPSSSSRPPTPAVSAAPRAPRSRSKA